MLPRWHILLGLIFSLLIWILFPSIGLYVFAILFGSIFIDFDHYMHAIKRTGKISLLEAFDYHEQLKKKELAEKARGVFRKGDFHIFHTVEFHLIILLLGYIWAGFFYMFIGMLFHSMLDFIELNVKGMLYRREFFLINWLIKRTS